MGFNIGGIQIQSPMAQLVLENKQAAEEVIKGKIREAINDPAKTIREIQQPSPFSQFLDIKV
ncbi:hypothetical protein [Bacillus massilinigeriensis]|uniref:hypothetical protein n=1 Tax=Bacillus massilionigeriensis TaxID=1805475 RepID=UPI000A9C6C12|nr:hypothetical protein [Bacillus massilionigeriensis]